MNKTERHEVIVEDLEREPALRVNEMAKRYSVSPETIRRDLAELTKRGLINRTYGGAVRIITHEPSLSEREHLQVAERERIAKRAVEFVEADDVLMIGGGLTTRYFAISLALSKIPMTVITASFNVALALGSCPNIRVHMLPGEFNGREGLIEGADTVEALTKYRATKAFLGASGLNEEGPSDAAIPAGHIYRKMSERAAETFVLADSSKFGKSAMACYAPWGPAITLVTDKEPPKGLKSTLADQSTEIIIAEAVEGPRRTKS